MTDWFFLHDNLLTNVLNRFSVNLRPPPPSQPLCLWHAGMHITANGFRQQVRDVPCHAFHASSSEYVVFFLSTAARWAARGFAALAWLSLLSSAEFAEQTQLSRLIKWWCCMHTSQYAIIFCFLQTLVCNENIFQLSWLFWLMAWENTLTEFQKLACNKDSNHWFLSVFYFGLIILPKSLKKRTINKFWLVD